MKYPGLALAAVLLLTAVLYGFYLIPAFLASLAVATALVAFALKSWSIARR